MAVERARDPSLAGVPLVVGGAADGRGVVTCASYEARPYDLKAGMSLRRAHTLCPHAIFLPGDYPRYKEVSAGFMRILGSYSPFLEPIGLDEAFIDMTGFESIYSPPAEVAAKIKARVQEELNVIASVGIASSKVVAKVASDCDKPDGLVEVPPGDEARFLSPLPVERLPGVGAKTGEVLHRVMGVNTVGALANVSPPVLRRTLGALADLLLLWAKGVDHAPVVASASAKSISRETTFAQDTGSRLLLLDILRYLAERVGADLRQEGKRARSVVLKVRYEDFETITRQRTLEVSAADDGTVFETGAALLAKALKDGRKKVRLLGIGVTDLVSNAEQLGLFDNP